MEELRELLSRPGAYAHGVGRVEVVETHISLVFLAGERVFKVKKPVRFEFLDFSTLEARRGFCEEEVRLNRRLAPEWYLGVVPVVARGEGLAVLEVGQGVEGEEVVEWAVAMGRLPADRMMGELLERGEVDNQMMNSLAGTLARFHREAAEVGSRGTPEAVRGVVLGNLEECRGLAGLPERERAFLVDRARLFLAREGELLERRVREGRIRDGHGDLHAGNICFPLEGLAIYDCIEFSEAFRCGDVALDLAFLCMDLDYRGYPSFARYLVHRYVVESGDRELPRLMAFYKAHRAAVRGKVSALALAGAEGERRARLERDVLGYFQLAQGYELPPVLVLMCGLPATGKSWAGPAVARALRAHWLRSDVRRKVLGAVPLTAHVRGERQERLYSREMTARTYDSLLEQTAELLEDGHSVVVDATFSRADLRRRFVDLAARLGRPWLVLHMEADEATVRERMAARARDRGEVSDADLEVYLRAREAFEPPDEVDARRRVRVDQVLDHPERVAARVLEALVGAQR